MAPLVHELVVSLSLSAEQPPMASGVVAPGVMMPMPALYAIPLRVRNRPMPTPLAVLSVPWMILTCHCRMPVKASIGGAGPAAGAAGGAGPGGAGPGPGT